MIESGKRDKYNLFSIKKGVFKLGLINIYDMFIVVRVNYSCARCGTLSLDSLV